MTLTYTDYAIALLNDVIGPPEPAAEQERIERLHLARLGIFPAELDRYEKQGQEGQA